MTKEQPKKEEDMIPIPVSLGFFEGPSIRIVGPDCTLDNVMSLSDALKELEVLQDQYLRERNNDPLVRKKLKDAFAPGKVYSTETWPPDETSKPI